MRRPRNTADGIRFDRRIAPSKHGEAFFASDALHNSFGQQAVRRFNRQKHHPNAIFARGRQRETQLGTFAREKLVRDLDQNSGAIAGFRIASACAAMRKIDEDLQPFDDNVVRLHALNIDDETDAADIVFVSGIVETLLNRESDHD